MPAHILIFLGKVFPCFSPPVYCTDHRWGFVLYRASLPASNGWALDLQSPVHDYAHVLVNGHVVAMLDRSSGQTSLHLPAVGVGGSRAGVVNGAVNGAVNITQGGAGAVLDILVQAMGHENFGCGYWDRKGLTSSNVTVNGGAGMATSV